VALIGRIFVVLAGFVVACVAAASVMTFGLTVLAARNVDPDVRLDTFLGLAIGNVGDRHEALAWVIGLAAMVVAFYALLPAILVIAIAEGFRLRSVLLYMIAGGLAGLYCYLTLGFGLPSAEAGRMAGRGAEIVIAAGIAAGFVYWALAGRYAGAWRGARGVGHSVAGPSGMRSRPPT
jgi:hypothetical protein